MRGSLIGQTHTPPAASLYGTTARPTVACALGASSVPVATNSHYNLTVSSLLRYIHHKHSSWGQLLLGRGIRPPPTAPLQTSARQTSRRPTSSLASHHSGFLHLLLRRLASSPARPSRLVAQSRRPVSTPSVRAATPPSWHDFQGTAPRLARICPSPSPLDCQLLQQSTRLFDFAIPHRATVLSCD